MSAGIFEVINRGLAPASSDLRHVISKTGYHSKSHEKQDQSHTAPDSHETVFCAEIALGTDGK